MTNQRYQLQGLLGRGGMGLLYKAWDSRLERHVAIKLLANQLDRDAHRRAILEAKATTRVRSDHVVQVFDAGQIGPSGCPYFVMELLVGEDLQAVIQRGPVAPERAVDWILQACEALAHLNLHGLVHRDIKPANLFLEARVDGSLRLKLVDFGVAKDLNGHLWQRENLTNDGQLIGSLPYMSPEQVLDSRSVDVRADVWGLGAVLYELLAGEPAFPSQPRADSMLQITRRRHTPLWMLSLDIPAGLSDVVDRCLEKTREGRWPDIAALARALAPYASSTGAALVPRICAICRARLPRDQRYAPAPEPLLPATPSALGERARFEEPESDIDFGSLGEPAEFIATVPSPAAPLSQRGATPSVPRRMAGALRGAGLGGPVALALALAIVFTWPTTSPFASDCAEVASYPAAGMVHDVGERHGASGWNIHSEGGIRQVHPFERGEAVLRVIAAGHFAGDELPNMRISIDGQEIGSADIHSAEDEGFDTYSFPYVSAGGDQTVQIEYTNDALTGGFDRNLLVETMTIEHCTRAVR